MKNAFFAFISRIFHSRKGGNLLVCAIFAAAVFAFSAAAQECPPCDATTLQFWGVIGTWFAGAATFAAVVVSLWIALDKNRVKLKIKVVLGYNVSYKVTRCLWFRVTNEGDKPANIQQLGLKVRRGKIKNEVLLIIDKSSVTASNLSSDTVPKILNYGEKGSFSYPFYKMVELFTDKEYSEKDIRATRAIIATSVRSFVVKIDKNFIKELIKEVAARRK